MKKVPSVADIQVDSLSIDAISEWQFLGMVTVKNKHLHRYHTSKTENIMWYCAIYVHLPVNKLPCSLESHTFKGADNRL